MSLKKINNILLKLSNSLFIIILVALIIYGIYAIILGLNFAPALYIIFLSFKKLILFNNFSIKNLVYFSLTMGANFYFFYIYGSIFLAILIRIFSAEILTISVK